MHGGKRSIKRGLKSGARDRDNESLCRPVLNG